MAGIFMLALPLTMGYTCDMTTITLHNTIIDGIDFTTVPAAVIVEPIQRGRPFFVDTAQLVFPVPDRFTLSEGAFELMPTGTEWAWRVTLSYGSVSLTRTVFVNGESARFIDLVDVDPETLVPSDDPVDGWRVARAKTIVGGSVVNGVLFLQRYDGTSFRAGDVDGPQGKQGPQGKKGDDGDDGRNAIITGAIAVPLAPGSLPTVLPGGTPQARSFEFGIPEGQPGVSAKILSASASALAAGANPTVTLGGTETERTFAFGIPRGANGANGSSASITGATAVPLAPGATPTVTVGGTALARSFEFGIPQGQPGVNGSPTAADLPWTDISTDLLEAFRGTLWARIRYGQVEFILMALGAGSCAVGNTTIGTVRAAFRPDNKGNRRGEAYFANGFAGMLSLTPGGELIVSQQTGVARTGLQGAIQFPQG